MSCGESQFHRKTAHAQHESKTIPGYYTETRLLIELISQSFATREETLASERQIKGWSRNFVQPKLTSHLKYFWGHH